MTAEEYQTEAERITPQLRQTALRYMGDASLSEDIAQDVLLRLWQLLDELRTRWTDWRSRWCATNV